MSKFNYFEFRYQKLNMMAFVCACNQFKIYDLVFFILFLQKKKTDRKEGLNLN